MRTIQETHESWVGGSSKTQSMLVLYAHRHVSIVSPQKRLFHVFPAGAQYYIYRPRAVVGEDIHPMSRSLDSVRSEWLTRKWSASRPCKLPKMVFLGGENIVQTHILPKLPPKTIPIPQGHQQECREAETDTIAGMFQNDPWCLRMSDANFRPIDPPQL